MFLKPDGKIELPHRAYFFLRGTPPRSVAVAAADDGRFSVMSADMKVVRSTRYPSKIRAISPHPSDERLALVDAESGSLIVQTVEGERLLRVAAPRLHDGAPDWIKPGFDDCYFDPSGQFLWLAAPVRAEECEIRLIDAGTGEVVAQTMIADPFGGSSCSFHSTGHPDIVSLWLAAGQDGQQVYWLKRDEVGFSCTLEPRLRNTIPPVFSPSGEHFLVGSEGGFILRYDFPSMEQVGSPLEAEDDDNPFAESLAFLNERRALVGTNEGWIFLVDTVQMKIEEEVSVEGHEKRPIGEYYPRLAKEPGLATDISGFTRLGDICFFVFRRDRGAQVEGWKDTLLWVNVHS